MKNQRPHLNALSRRLLLRRWVNKRRMRHPPRPPIRLGVVKLDQSNHIRSLLVAKVPLDVWVCLDVPRLALLVRGDKLDGEQAAFGRRVRIGKCQRVLENGTDRAPDADHLVAAPEELGCFVGKIVPGFALGAMVGRVDVNTFERTTGLTLGGPIFCGSSDGVVIYEDPRGPRAVLVNRLICPFWNREFRLAYTSFSSCSVSG